MAINIQVGDRWAIVGASGSGKTWLSRDILRAYAQGTRGRVPIVILDTKVAGDFRLFEANKDLTQVVEGNDPEKAVSVMGKKVFTVWRPETDDFSMYDQFFEGVYYRGRKKGLASITYIDEISSMVNGLGRAPLNYDKLLKQGRGINLGTISVTQSPAFIPQSMLRQTTHLIRLHLNEPYDLQKLAKIGGPEIMQAPEDDFGFWYRNCTKPRHKSPALYFADKSEFLGLSPVKK